MPNGYAEKEVAVSKSGYSYAIENDAMIGASADISISDTCNPEEIVLKYNIKEAYIDNTLNLYSSLEEFQGIKRLNIFKFHEDTNMLLPVETEFDVENGLLYAEVDELGTYCIMDLEIWFNMLGVVPEIELEEQSYTLFDPEIQDNTFLIDNQTSFKKYFFKNQTYALYEKTGLSWEDAKRYCESLGGHLVTITSPEEQNFINNILSDSYNNLYWIGAKKVNNRWSWVTGEQFAYVNWAENEPSPQTNENYVHIYAKSNSNSINKGEWNNTVSFYNGVHSFYNTSNCGFICEWEDNPNIPQEYCIIVPTNWKKISLNGELNPSNNIDTDGDTLTDWKEVDTARLIWNEDGSFDIPTFNIAELTNHLIRFQSPDYNFLYDDMKNNKPRYYLPILSDPTEEDSDGDGILDPDEYINLTSDSRYDNINPLKADTVETLYPELTRNSKTNVDTNPIYLDINNNTITLKVKYKLNNKAYELSNIIKPNSTEYYTNEEIIMKSISDKWNTNIQGNIFDFYPGMSIKVKIELKGVICGKYIEFIIGDDGNNSTWYKDNIWNTNKIRYVKLSTKNGDGKYSDEVNRFAAPAHEFGHTLGLTDVYGYNNSIEWRLQPVIYDISKTTQNEIWYKDSEKNPDGDLMYSFGLVRANDIEMILQAYCDNQEQYFKPEFDKENEVSKAIKQNQNNIYLDRMNKEFVIYDSVSRTTTSIGDAYAYQKFLKDNYGINVTITELEKVYGKNNITS